MNKKGFTLVELLAVIAILAILVIVALPNVIGTLNTARSSTFTEEVQTIFKQAQSQFLAESVKTGGSGVNFYEVPTAIGHGLATADVPTNSKTLTLDGNEKSYRVLVDRNGKVTQIDVIDANFCYTKTAATGGEIKITEIKVDDVKQTKDSDVLGTCGGDPAEN